VCIQGTLSKPGSGCRSNAGAYLVTNFPCSLTFVYSFVVTPCLGEGECKLSISVTVTPWNPRLSLQSFAAGLIWEYLSSEPPMPISSFFMFFSNLANDLHSMEAHLGTACFHLLVAIGYMLERCHAPNRFGTVNMEDNVNIK